VKQWKLSDVSSSLQKRASLVLSYSDPSKGIVHFCCSAIDVEKSQITWIDKLSTV